MGKNKLLGTGWQFPPYFDYYNKSVGTVDGSDSIRESLKILLTTRPGERSAAPQYGCDLTPLAFESLRSQQYIHFVQLGCQFFSKYR